MPSHFLVDEEIDTLTPKQIWLNGLKRLKTWRFWRNLAVYFCVFSVVGHCLEYVYCMFNSYFFGIVDPNSGVWNSPFYPYFVYGFGVVVVAVVMVPYRAMLIRWRLSDVKACLHFFTVGILAAMAMELAQGFIQNQPDEFGNYPLWDNSHLPGNILGQAWIVNDILISLIMTFFAWVAYPLCERGFAKLSDKAANILAAIVIVGTVVLTVYMYGTYG